tara:strand:+ start:214 stop:477 length:264 start_codon:yes stop_codon:yes gene_type:complete
MGIIVNGIDGSNLITLIQKIERLEEEKKSIQEDAREVFSEAKSLGFDVKILREILKIRKSSESELYEKETLLDLYMRALGMLPELDA